MGVEAPVRRGQEVEHRVVEEVPGDGREEDRNDAHEHPLAQFSQVLVEGHPAAFSVEHW